MCRGALQVSEDGKTFNAIREFDADASAISINFNEVVSRHFRVEFSKAEWYLEQINVADIELSPEFRIDDIDSKALFVANKDPEAKTPLVPEVGYHRFSLSGNRDISSHFKRGRLDWEVPEGTWTILRFGHCSTGEDNQPAPESGRGLECDKLSKEAARAAFGGLIGKLARAVGPLAGDTFVATHVDSWEVGSQNWTPKFREEFDRLRGYDPLPFLPVMTGRVIGSLELSERFLWDLRQTVSDLIAQNYAGELQKLAHRWDMQLTMEAYDLNPSDDLTFAGHVDQPMAEFWTWPAYGVAYSCMEMASAAHVYGKPIVSAEAFTATDAEKWVAHPFTAKVFGDWAFCHGINRFVLHRYAHQPWTNPDRPPGMSMGPWGLHYERTQTWWEQARPWHDYLTRCQFLLQQGLYVADICYLEKEGAPQKWEAPGKPKERPGYNFDGCPPEIVSRMTVKNGRIVLPDGMNYRVLVLADSDAMTPQLLDKITRLVKAGATVIGPKPVRSPSLSEYPDCDNQVSLLADELWGDCDGKTVKENRVGKGRIIWGIKPEEVFAQNDLPMDFTSQTTSSTDAIRYTHRMVGADDLYFLANKQAQPTDALCAFRVQNKYPEIWRPDQGTIERPAMFDQDKSTIRVPLRFEPNGSLFVVFRNGLSNSNRVLSVRRDGVVIQNTRLDPPPPIIVHTNESVTNTFTMAAWVKPEIEIDLPEETKSGIGGLHVLRNDALYPPPGQDVYADTGHAGSGVSVGRNGVCVFEHGDNYFASPLVFEARVTNWTHLAVVYLEGKPTLYLDGNLAHSGLNSDFVVHPGVGVPHRRGVAPFRGQVGNFELFDRALDPSDLAHLMQTMPKPPAPTALPGVELKFDDQGELLARVWQPGSYEVAKAEGKSLAFNAQDLAAPFELNGRWDLNFDPNRGAPEHVLIDSLISWTEHSDPGVRFYSGQASYRKTFGLPSEYKASNLRLYLDLGQVAVMAEVKVNGTKFVPLWKPPFRLDVTDAMLAGQNSIEIKVVNLWCNRMIGDESLPEDSDRKENGTLKDWPNWLGEGKPSPTGRYAFTSWRLWKKTSPLQQSGLLGPVRIIPVREIRLSPAQ